MVETWMAKGGWRIAEGSRGINVAPRKRLPIGPRNRPAGDSAIRHLPSAI